MQAAVEHIERQLSVAKKSWKEYEERAHAAEVNYYMCDIKEILSILLDFFREVSARCWKDTTIRKGY